MGDPKPGWNDPSEDEVLKASAMAETNKKAARIEELKTERGKIGNQKAGATADDQRKIEQRQREIAEELKSLGEEAGEVMGK